MDLRELVLAEGETARLMKSGVPVMLQFGASGVRLDPNDDRTPLHLAKLREWRGQVFTDGAAI